MLRHVGSAALSFCNHSCAVAGLVPLLYASPLLQSMPLRGHLPWRGSTSAAVGLGWQADRRLSQRLRKKTRSFTTSLYVSSGVLLP